MRIRQARVRQWGGNSRERAAQAVAEYLGSEVDVAGDGGLKQAGKVGWESTAG